MLNVIKRLRNFMFFKHFQIMRYKTLNEELAKPIKLSKPSLDSDEEDYDEKKCFRLLETDIVGQEAATLDYDNKIKITPFNMKEELEEDGYFDAEGTFIFKKSNDARDNWLDDIDWLEVKKREEMNTQKDGETINDELDKVIYSSEQKLGLYKLVLHYLKPKENVLRGIKRMGACSDSKTSGSASQRWLCKNKNNQTYSSGDPEGLIKLTEHADRLFQMGDFDIYQKTYEIISNLVKEIERNVPDDDDELDALGQVLDKEETSKPSDQSTEKLEEETQIMWHLKRSALSDAEVEGPFSSETLRIWRDEGKFKDCPCVLARESTKTGGQFYNITRIDFDLF